jgi:hypothetical protein
VLYVATAVHKFGFRLVIKKTINSDQTKKDHEEIEIHVFDEAYLQGYSK